MMNVFDFITKEEVDDLPDDDPNAAFVSFVRIAQRSLGQKTAEISGDQDGWREIEDARYAFQNVVIAAAKKFGIEPFASLIVPRLTEFKIEHHRQFAADLDHFMT